MDQTNEFLLPTKYHEKLVDWHKRNFPELGLLEKHWSKFFPDQTPFQLCVKLDQLKSTKIEVGMFQGQEKISRAGDMKGNMFYSALRIIKAQCSTELGSIQQHMCTVDSAPSDESKFKILRIMAEELRHAYQMFWVLSHDSTWSTGGVQQLADTAMEELLAMHTGTHVLDAFNIPFYDPLDNIVFAFLIDRVGKYQLTMQKVFSYAPMSQSMSPMLKEESFHLQAGYELLREIVSAAAVDRGQWSLDEIQRRFNAWFPRALEMFGNPEGGSTNVVFGFKDRDNGESASQYAKEVDRLIKRFNLAIVEARRPDLTREEAELLVEEGAYPDFIKLPDASFFRTRGPDWMALQPIDTHGGKLDSESYMSYLQGVLPAYLANTDFYKKYCEDYQARQAAA